MKKNYIQPTAELHAISFNPVMQSLSALGFDSETGTGADEATKEIWNDFGSDEDWTYNADDFNW